MKKVLYATVLLLIGPAACEECPDVAPYFTIDAIVGRNMFKPNEGPSVFITDNNLVSWENYEMFFSLDVTYTSHQRSNTGASAFADCENAGYMGSKVGLDTMYLITLTQYNESFEAGDTLNTIAQVADGYSTEFLPITDFIASNRGNIHNENFIVRLFDKPLSSIDPFQFRLVYQLNNGDVFSTTLDPILLTD